MTALVRTLIFTHVTVFAAGFMAGKSIDADELDLYRNMHESRLSRARRNAGKLGLAVAAAGVVILVGRMAARSRR